MEILEIVGLLKFDWNRDKRLLHVFDDGSEIQIHGNSVYVMEKNQETEKFRVKKFNLTLDWEEDSA